MTSVLDSWSLIGAVVESPRAKATCAKSVQDVTCEEWRTLLPEIKQKMICLAQEPERVLDLDGEKIDCAKGMDVLMKFVEFVQKICNDEDDRTPQMAIYVPRSCR